MGKELSEMSVEELWELFPTSLVSYKDTWEIDYHEMSVFLENVLSVCPVERISHIGSTAIAGIWAKDIIDILVEISQNSDMEKTAAVIEANGWIRMSAEKSRISFNRGYTKDGFAAKVFHLHLRYAGDHDELYFRDYLKEHPPVAGEYEALKLRLWKQFERNRDAYTEAKTAFIRKWTREAKKVYAKRYE